MATSGLQIPATSGQEVDVPLLPTLEEAAGGAAAAVEGAGTAEAAPECTMEEEVPGVTQATQPEVELVRFEDRPLHLGASKEQWLFLDRPVDLDSLFFDHDMKFGQIRQLSEDLLIKKRNEFLMEEPLGPVRALVAAQDLSGVGMVLVGLLSLLLHFMHNLQFIIYNLK